MNDNEIYELINESFEDKIKLDFDDVKKRIAALPEKNAAVISIAPSHRKNNIVYIISAVAACLVCAVGLTIFFSAQNAESAKSEDMYFSSYAAESAVCEEAAYEAECDEAPSAFGAVYNDSLESCDDFDTIAECIKEESSPSDILSDSDISPSDIN